MFFQITFYLNRRKWCLKQDYLFPSGRSSKYWYWHSSDSIYLSLKLKCFKKLWPASYITHMRRLTQKQGYVCDHKYTTHPLVNPDQKVRFSRTEQHCTLYPSAITWPPDQNLPLITPLFRLLLKISIIHHWIPTSTSVTDMSPSWKHRFYDIKNWQ